MQSTLLSRSFLTNGLVPKASFRCFRAAAARPVIPRAHGSTGRTGPLESSTDSLGLVAASAIGAVTLLVGGGYAFYHFSGAKRIVDAYQAARESYRDKKAAILEKAQQYNGRFSRSGTGGREGQPEAQVSVLEKAKEKVKEARENRGTVLDKLPKLRDVRGDTGKVNGGVAPGEAEKKWESLREWRSAKKGEGK